MTMILGINEVSILGATGIGVAGGIATWDVELKPDFIESGKNKAPSMFVILGVLQTAIDDIPAGTENQIIIFNKKTSRWQIVSSDNNFKGTFATVLELQTAIPAGKDGYYAFITDTFTFWSWYGGQTGSWQDTSSALAPDSLRSVLNLSDLSDKSISRSNLDVYSKLEIDNKVKIKKVAFTNQSTVTLDHNLGYNPIIQVYDNDNKECFVEIEQVNSNRSIVRSNSLLTGYILYY
jgi:hypothetical protein